MVPNILNGKVARDARIPELISRILKVKDVPALAIISFGEDERQSAYIGQKKAFGEKIGVTVIHKKLPAKCTEAAAEDVIVQLNADKGVHGIIIQLPVPPQLSVDTLCALVDPLKDVDGLHPENIGLLVRGAPRFVPATSKGIMSLLDFYTIPVSGKRVAIVGRSLLVGKPLAQLLLKRDATVTIAHSKTTDLESVINVSDIVVVAVGKPGLITGTMILPGSVIIDVGITRIEEGGKAYIVGDADAESVSKVAGALSPVPGGVGPMTVLSLFENVCDAYDMQKGL